MGIHICLIDKDGKDHKEWDYLREKNDRDFPSLVQEDNFEEGKNYHPWGFDFGFRPINLNSIRERINKTEWENKERYMHLLDLIERDKEYWLHFSW